MSDRRFGIPPQFLDPIRAADQLRKVEMGARGAVEPLPQPYAPAVAMAAQLGIVEADPLTFVMFGDCGGVKNPDDQNLVAAAMASLRARGVAPAFALILGDLVYFNGDPSEWVPQFYEPYAHSLGGLPIISFPGNHDGDSSDGIPGSGIASWMANMATATPQVPPGDPSFEYQRHTQTLPSHDWTLELAELTIITLWSNVPSGGHFEPEQIAWLTQQLKDARPHVPIMLGTHHPPLCASEDTEILTPNGWRRYDQIAPGAIVMTLNHDTGLSEWQPCSAIYHFDVVDEPMVAIEGNAHSSLTTLEHRWPVLHRVTRGPAGVRLWNLRERAWKTSESLVSTDHLVTGARCADLPTERTFRDDFVEAVAWFYTEGSVARRYVMPQATICQSRTANPEKVARIRRALTGLYGEATQTRMSYGRSTMLVEPKWREYEETTGKTEFWLNTPASVELLAVAPDKVVSLDFIHALTFEQLELFVEVSLAADGHDLWLTQNRWDRLAAFEMACVLIGRTPHSYADRTKRALKDGSIAKTKKVVHASLKDNVHIASAGARNRSTYPQRTTFTGTVWCPTTRNGSWLARRNGTVFYTGNSVDAHHGGSRYVHDTILAAAEASGRSPDIVVGGHVHDYQHFAWSLPDRTIPAVVSGNGGYHNLHRFASDATPGMQADPDVVFVNGDDKNFGFCVVTATGGKVSGEYVSVGRDGTVTRNADTF